MDPFFAPGDTVATWPTRLATVSRGYAAVGLQPLFRGTPGCVGRESFHVDAQVDVVDARVDFDFPDMCRSWVIGEFFHSREVVDFLFLSVSGEGVGDVHCSVYVGVGVAGHHASEHGPYQAGWHGLALPEGREVVAFRLLVEQEFYCLGCLVVVLVLLEDCGDLVAEVVNFVLTEEEGLFVSLWSVEAFVESLDYGFCQLRVGVRQLLVDLPHDCGFRQFLGPNGVGLNTGERILAFGLAPVVLQALG